MTLLKVNLRFQSQYVNSLLVISRNTCLTLLDWLLAYQQTSLKLGGYMQVGSSQTSSSRQLIFVVDLCIYSHHSSTCQCIVMVERNLILVSFKTATVKMIRRLITKLSTLGTVQRTISYMSLHVFFFYFCLCYKFNSKKMSQFFPVSLQLGRLAHLIGAPSHRF